MMNATLLQFKKDRKIPTTKYYTLRCSSGRTPSIYGLPKIHKPDILLWPIVLFYSSPTYELSKFLVQLLSPLVGNTPSAVKNSREFASFIQQVRLQSDVISLFTRILVELAISVAHSCLESDEFLSEHTNLSIDDIVSLLSLCLKAMYFTVLSTDSWHSYGLPCICSGGKSGDGIC